MIDQSLDAMQWPPGGDPTAPKLPDVGDLVELGPEAELPEGHRSFVARVEAVRSAGPEYADLLVNRDDVTPQRRAYRVRAAGIRIVEKAS